MKHFFRNPDRAIELAASRWIGRVDAGMTEAERLEFEQWRASDLRHAEALARHEKTWQRFDGPRAVGQAARMIDALAVSRVRRRRRSIRGFATVLAACFVAGLLWLQRATGIVREDPGVPTYSYAVVMLPERRTLPDGSSVELKPGARMQTLNLMRQADGQKVEQGRAWRANFVTRYSFTEGTLRGAHVGGGYRWRSKPVLGYRLAFVDNAFPFAGAPAQLNVPALNSPIYGEALHEVEIFLGYSRRIGKRLNWRVQLNIRNLFDDQDPVSQRANLGQGFVTTYTLPEPRSFILTNTFSF